MKVSRAILRSPSDATASGLLALLLLRR